MCNMGPSSLTFKALHIYFPLKIKIILQPVFPSAQHKQEVTFNSDAYAAVGNH